MRNLIILFVLICILGTASYIAGGNLFILLFTGIMFFLLLSLIKIYRDNKHQDHE